MSWQREPEFLTREIVDAIHEEQLNLQGGLHGLRNEGGLESAIAQAKNVYYYGDGDVYELAAAYAFHIAESQAYLDGNKRTAMQAALVFPRPSPSGKTSASVVGTVRHKPEAIR